MSCESFGVVHEAIVMIHKGNCATYFVDALYLLCCCTGITNVVTVFTTNIIRDSDKADVFFL